MDTNLARKHLNLLFSEKLEGEYIEIRIIEGKKRAQKFFYQTIDEAVRALEGEDLEGKMVSVGIHPRSEPSGKKTSVKRCKFCVIDIDWDDASQIMNYEELFNLLEENGLKPAMIIFSGKKGYHIYFQLSEWVSPSDWEKFQNYLINKFRDLGLPADTQIRDVARVMRLAGTLHNKTKNLVKILYYDPSKQIEVLSIYSKVVPKQSVIYSCTSASHKQIVDFFRELWVKGHRQSLTLWLSGYLRKCGWDYNSVLAVIKDICKVTGDEEVQQRESAVKYTFMKELSEIKGIEGLREKLRELIPLKYQSKGMLEINMIIEEKLRELKNIVKPKEDVLTEVLIEDEYLLRAKNLYNLNPYFFDTETGFFYVYDAENEVYRQMDDDEVLAYFLEYFDVELRQNITSSSRKNRLLQGMKLVGIQRKPKMPKPTWIKFKGVIVDVETMEMIKPSHEYFFVNSIPHALGTSEETPTIDKLFESWVGAENKRILYEICAYAMLRDYPIHRIFILYGSGRNGKGSFTKMLIKFIGKNNVVSTELERLDASRFETARLYQKLLAVCGETNFTTIKNSAVLKSLSGQDPIPAEYKFKNRFEFVNYAKILISTNMLPMTLDTTDGFYARTIIIDFPNRFETGKDIIREIPEWEFENLALKCLRILKELLERGSFHNEGTIEEKAERYEERANPVRAFIKEMCVVDPEGYIPSTEFYMKFVNWMRIKKPRFRVPEWKHGVKPVLESMGFETGVRKWIGESQKRCIVGLSWKDSVTLVTDVTHTILLENSKNQNNKVVSQASQVSQDLSETVNFIKQSLESEGLSLLPEHIIKKALSLRDMNKSELIIILEKFGFPQGETDKIIEMCELSGLIFRKPDGTYSLL